MHTKTHKNPCDLDLWPMTLIFNRLVGVVEVHLCAKFHHAKCSGSWVIVFTENKKLSDDAENNIALVSVGSNDDNDDDASGTWLMLTWSLGCTGVLEPSCPPSISMARLAITSLMFMLVCVPEPVCHTTNGKWLSSFPDATCNKRMACLCGSLAQCTLSLKRLSAGPGFNPLLGWINCFTISK